MFFYQKNLIFFPSKQILNTPNDPNVKEVNFTTSDGITLNGRFLDKKSDKTILFFHGNAGNISFNISQLEIFDKLGLNALMFDYRGYGKSQGNINKESDLYTDANAAFEYLTKSKGIDPKNIIIWGRSLGGAIAIDTAQDKDIYCTIIESTFTSLDNMASELYPRLPTKLLMKYHFESINKVINIKSNILFIHSQNDEVIPFNHSRKLFSQTKSQKSSIELKGSHDDGFILSNDIYINGIRKFINKNN